MRFCILIIKSLRNINALKYENNITSSVAKIHALIKIRWRWFSWFHDGGSKRFTSTHISLPTHFTKTSKASLRVFTSCLVFARITRTFVDVICKKREIVRRLQNRCFTMSYVTIVTFASISSPTVNTSTVKAVFSVYTRPTVFTQINRALVYFICKTSTYLIHSAFCTTVNHVTRFGKY